MRDKYQGRIRIMEDIFSEITTQFARTSNRNPYDNCCTAPVYEFDASLKQRVNIWYYLLAIQRKHIMSNNTMYHIRPRSRKKKSRKYCKKKLYFAWTEGKNVCKQKWLSSIRFSCFYFELFGLRWRAFKARTHACENFLRHSDIQRKYSKTYDRSFAGFIIFSLNIAVPQKKNPQARVFTPKPDLVLCFPL